MKVITAQQDKWTLLQARVHEANVIAAFKEFRKAGIEPILIKGWAAARNYPPDAIRSTTDIDLAVAPKEYGAAIELTKRPEVGHLVPDIHEGLRYLDTVEWNDLFDNSILADLDRYPVRILCAEDHLRVLCIHWLVDGGRFKDKLWDIYYAVSNRPPDFDWKRCLDVVSNNRRTAIICAVGLAHKYLGLPIEDLPFADEAKRIPGWVTKCIEREWKRKGLLEPVLVAAHQGTRPLLEQIRRRLPPNPIRATIEAEGDIFGSKRCLYQAAVIGRRIGPFSRNALNMALRRLKGPRS
jgi:hypothetical protein